MQAPTLTDEAIGGEESQNRETVLIIGPTPPPAHGISVLTELLLRSDLKESFEVVHLDTADRRTLDNVGRFELGNVALALYHGVRFLWLLLRRRPALVYLPVSESRLGFLRDCLFLVPCRVFGIPLVLHLHGGQLDTLYAQGGKGFRWLMRFCFSHATRGIVLSESFRAKFAGLVEDERVRVVYNGIPLTIYEAGKNKYRSNRNSTTRTVLFLGVLIESKGFFDLLRAVPLVLERTKEVRFVFVGDTSFPECARAKEWGHEHALGPYVSFLGTRSGDEKTQVFLESDIFAFPTWYPLEGQPVAMIEAMAAGLPVVTTRHATIPDILGEDGALYVNERDPADIAEKLLHLLEDESLRKSMGQKNQSRFLQWHTADKFAAGVGGVLREALCVPSHAVDCVEGL